MERGMRVEGEGSSDQGNGRSAARNWRRRIILSDRVGVTDVPGWLATSYATLREQVMDPAYPCFFGTQAERHGKMFYSFVLNQDIATLPATMATFAALVSCPEYDKNNIAIFFEPDPQPLSHQDYHAIFWHTLQYLHDRDPDPVADQQPHPSDPAWEFSFAGVQMFVVCACPSFTARHSRNLGPGMVLLFQPRSAFIDKVTNRVIGLQARREVRHRLRAWDAIPAHPDLGVYGDPSNREWKQYFLPDDNTPVQGACPFLTRRSPSAAAEQARLGINDSTPVKPMSRAQSGMPANEATLGAVDSASLRHTSPKP